MSVTKGSPQRFQENSWESVSGVLRRMEGVPTPEYLAGALVEIAVEIFSMERLALCWRAPGRRHFKILETPLSLPIGSSRLPRLFEELGVPENAHGNFTLDGIPCQFTFLQTSDELELFFAYSSYMPVDYESLAMTLRLWGMRWERALLEQDRAIVGLQLARVRSVTEDLGKGMEYKPLLSRILKMTLSLVDADHGFIMIADENSNALKTEVVYGLPNPAAERLVYEDLLHISARTTGEGIQARVMQTRQPVMIDKINDYRGTGLGHDTHSIICVPLVKQDQAFGVIYVSNKRDSVRFSPQDLDLVCILASNVAALVDQVRLYKKSITDSLTGLYLRRHFEPKLEHEVKRTIRYGVPLSLLTLDADLFKQVNDTYGHLAGDSVLRTIADLLRRNIRTDIDLPVRMGGEEFAILLPETPEAGALILAERIRQQMETTPLRLGSDTRFLTLSIGVASCPEHGSDAETLVGNADKALYASKTQGRNRVTSYGSLL